MSIPLSTMATARADDSTVAGWQTYPARINNENPRTQFAKIEASMLGLSGQLSSLKKVLFSDDIDLQIIDVRESGERITCNCKSYEQEAEVENLLQKPDSELPKIRIISFHSEKSPLPIDTTESLMRKILTRYKVDPAFLHILFSFGDSPRNSECGSNNFASTKLSDGSQSKREPSVAFNPYNDWGTDTSYQIRYTEMNHRSPTTPWSIRQTGIYHHRSGDGNFNLFILIHPLVKSPLEEELLSKLKDGAGSAEAKAFCENPYRLHVLPFALYLDNWRWYHRGLSDNFQKLNDQVMTLDLKTSDVIGLNFENVQGLRDLKDDTLTLSAYCKASQGIIQALKLVPESSLDSAWTLDPYEQRLGGFMENILVMTGMISNTIDLYAYALDLKNQYTAADTNQNVYDLSKKTTRDTTTVKWITYLTLFYLPGSFVASLYGMNLFVFNQDSNRLVVAQDFWIYVATWIPLTAVTFLLYGLVVLLHEPPGTSRWDWMRLSNWNFKGGF